MNITADVIAQSIDRYEHGITVLREAVSGLEPDMLDRQPKPNKWSIRQIVAHLVDAEIVYVMRIRKVMAEGSGHLVSFEQDNWVTGLAAQLVPVEASIQAIAGLREFELVSLRSLEVEAFQRVGQHDTRGDVTAFEFLQIVTNHLEHHVRQIHDIAALSSNRKSEELGE